MIKYDLTSAQKNIYELQSFYKGTSISVLCGAVIFEEKLDKEILMQAVRLLIQKHEALRLRFCTENGKAMQYVDGAYCDEIDFMEFHSPDEMRNFCNKQAHIPFEMNGSQMFRITVFELPESSGIMLCASHLIADAWTYSVLAKDVFDIYLMLCKGEKADIEACSFTESIEKNPNIYHRENMKQTVIIGRKNTAVIFWKLP